MSDFDAFYRAAKIIMDPNISSLQVYNSDALNSAFHGVSDENITFQYRYSMFATYLIAPLALFNYREAEAILTFLNLFCYAVSMFIILKAFGASKRSFLYPYAISFLWMPFIKNIQFGQINAILFLFMTVAIVLARNNRYLLSGILLAIASLFKPFFLAITMVLCIKNWRIIIGYLATIILALMLPGTVSWFNSFLWPPHPFFCYSAAYSYLGQLNEHYFVIYAMSIGIITALIAYRNRQLDFFAIASLAIPGGLLAMPVLEPNHLTILIFCYAFFIYQKSNIKEKILVAVSFLMIYLGSCSVYGGKLIYVGLVILWIAMAYMVTKVGKLSFKKEITDAI